MFNKSFVSAYFTSEKIRILLLNGSKKKVKKYASFDLPKGVLDGNRVRNKKSLANILKGIWEKLRLREKTVALVIPEFLTFTKLITIPKVNMLELDEAVRWEAQEFLPRPLSEMIMDWKIVERKDDGYEILTVAIEKEILSEFVEACELAGLFPLAVEISSVCLTKLLNEKELGGKLILYRSKSETIMVFANANKIIGSSVLAESENSLIVETIKRMRTHYKETKIEKVYVGGVGIDDVLIGEINKLFGVRTSWIKPQVVGLSENETQEYLIPICMQLEGLEEPSSPMSLNLLPSELVDKYRLAKLKVQIWGFTLTVTLFVWASFLITLGAYLILMQQLGEYKTKNDAKRDIASKRQKIISDVSYINGVSDRVKKIKDLTFVPQVLIDEVNKAKPAGITITYYKLDLDTGKIFLKGISSSRIELISFKDNLDANPNMDSIQIPITSFEAENNLEFGLDFEYKPYKQAILSTK